MLIDTASLREILKTSNNRNEGILRKSDLSYDEKRASEFKLKDNNDSLMVLAMVEQLNKVLTGVE